MRSITQGAPPGAAFSTLEALWAIRDDREMDADEVRVLNALIAFCNADGQCNPSTRTLADVARMRVTTVRAALLKLEKRAGPVALSVTRATAGDGPPKRDAKGHVVGNVYRLTLTQFQQSQGSGLTLVPVAPGFPNDDPRVPKRPKPGSNGHPEEDLYKEDLKDEWTRATQSVRSPTQSAKEESEQWWNADHAKLAADKGLDVQTLAADFVASGKPLASYQDLAGTFGKFIWKRWHAAEAAKEKARSNAIEAEIQALPDLPRRFVESRIARGSRPCEALGEIKKRQHEADATAKTEAEREARQAKEREAMSPEERATDDERHRQFMAGTPIAEQFPLLANTGS